MHHKRPARRNLFALFALLVGVLLQIGPLRASIPPHPLPARPSPIRSCS